MDLLWPSWFYRLFLPMCIIFICSPTGGYSQNFSQPVPLSASRDFSEISSSTIDEFGATDGWASHGIEDMLKSNTSILGADILSQCNAFQESFSVESAKFIKCSVHNARPLRVCEKCVGFHERAKDVYKNFENVSSPCHDQLLKADRVQVMVMVYNTIQDIWNTAYCDNCFTSVTLDDKNGTVSYNLSNSTVTFLELYNNTISCFNQTNGTAPPDMPVWNSSLCFECRSTYRTLNTFFDDTMAQYNRKVCMDIVDMMNHTRRDWGLTYNCTHSNRQDAPIIALTVCLLCAPAFLYGGARLWASQSQRLIIKEKRFKRGRRNTGYGSVSSSRSPTPNPNANPNLEPNMEPNGVDSHPTTRARDTPLQSPLE